MLRQAWRRGVLGGSPAWTVLGGVGVIAYLARRVGKREADIVFSEQLAPGESIRITHEGRS